MLGTLEARKKHALETWLNNPLLPFAEIAEKAGISETTFWSYRQDENFMEEYHKRCKQRFAELEALALENLAIKLENCDWNATKYALDSLDYSAKQKVDLSTSNTIKISIEE